MASNESIIYEKVHLSVLAKILMAVSLACICVLGVIGKGDEKISARFVNVNARKFNRSDRGISKTKLSIRDELLHHQFSDHRPAVFAHIGSANHIFGFDEYMDS